MRVEVNLKTGFHETASYVMAARKNLILLTPLIPGESKAGYVIAPDALNTVILRKKMTPEIEIRATHGVLCGTLAPDTDLERLYHLLKMKLDNKVVFEGRIDA